MGETASRSIWETVAQVVLGVRGPEPPMGCAGACASSALLRSQVGARPQRGGAAAALESPPPRLSVACTSLRTPSARPPRPPFRSFAAPTKPPPNLQWPAAPRRPGRGSPVCVPRRAWSPLARQVLLLQVPWSSLPWRRLYLVCLLRGAAGSWRAGVCGR